MNKSRSNVFIMLNLIVSFFISACSSPREQVKIENGTFNINGKMFLPWQREVWRMEKHSPW